MKNLRGQFPTYVIVQSILRRGNEPGLIAEWFDGMRAWAEANVGPDAAALKTWLGIVKARPFYTAAELSKFWPALKMTLDLSARLDPEPSPNRLANELVFYGLPTLKRNWEGNVPGIAGDWFGKPPQVYFIVEHCHKWREARLTQEEFANVLQHG